MKITNIKQQIKRTDRYSIYVDGRYVCSFSEAELLKLGLHSGQELTEGELEGLKDDSLKDKAYMRTLDLVSRRPRSEWELRDYMKRKGYDEEIVEATLNKLSNLDLINDKDFARRWIENRRLLKSTSNRRLVQELRQKHIADEIIEEVMVADPADEVEMLKELVERKRRQAKYHDDQKLMQYLARQGFSYDDIRSALSRE